MPEKHLRMRITGEDRASGTTDKVSKSMGGLIAKIGTAAVAYAALRTASKTFGGTLRFVSGEMKYSIDNLAKEELATLRLAQAMKTGQSYTQEAYEGALKYAEAMERQTLFTADQVIAAEAMLATFKLQPDVLRTATEMTLDLATATGADLVQASVLMGKAAVGVTGTLSRYGIIVDQTDLKLRGFAAVQDEINKEFGGQAQAMMASYAGTVDQVGKAYDYLVDVFGDLIVKAPEVRALFRTTSDELYRMADNLAASTESVSILATAFDSLAGILEKNKVLISTLAVLWNLMQASFYNLRGRLMTGWRQYDDLWRAITGTNEAVNKAIDYFATFSQTMRSNLVIEEQLADIRRATKDDLPDLQKQLKALSDTYGPANDQIGRQVEVVAALKGRIKELTAAYKEAVKVVKESYADTEAQTAYETAFIEWLEKRPAMEKEFAQAHYGVMTTEKQQEFDTLDERLAAYGVFVKDRAALEEWYMLERQDILERYAPETEETWAEHFGTMAQIQKRDFYDMAEQGMYALTDTMVDAMWDMKVQFKDIWKAMMKDAMKYFFAKAALAFLGIPGFSAGGTAGQMGDWTTGGPTYAQHGGRITGKDNIPVLAHYGERFVPEPQSTKYAPVLDRMISENRTGIPALGGGGGTGGDIYITIPVQTLDAKSFRESARHGMIQQEIAEALRRGYIDPRSN